MIELRPMEVDDIGYIRRWDDDSDVAAALGGRARNWYDWPTELMRDVPWRELLIVEEDGRPIGFIRLTDAREEESHYWDDIEPGRGLSTSGSDRQTTGDAVSAPRQCRQLCDASSSSIAPTRW